MLQGSRAIAVVQRKPGHVVQECIGADRARHEPGTHGGRLFTVLGGRIHQQRRHPGDGGRCHAGAIEADVARPPAIATGRVDAHARSNHLRFQAAVGGRTMTAETGQVAAVFDGPDGERVLGAREVTVREEAAIGLRDHVKLTVVPDDRVELALAGALAVPLREVLAQAHVDHECANRRRRWRPARARFRHEIHAPHDAQERSGAERGQHLGEADVLDQRSHSRMLRAAGAIAHECAGDVRSVQTRIDPEILIFLAVEEGEERGEIRPANAATTCADVLVADVQTRIHHPDRYRSAADPGEEACVAVVRPQCIRAHGWHRRGMTRLDDADRLDGEHEVSRGDGVEDGGREVGGIDTNARIESAHGTTQVGQGSTPASIRIVGHQGDERRYQAVHDAEPRIGVARNRELGCERGRAQARNAGQVRNRLQARDVAGQARTQQRTRCAEHLRTRGVQAPRQRRPISIGVDDYPAEGPVPSGRHGLAGQTADAASGGQPGLTGPGFGRRSGVERRHPRRGHLSVESCDFKPVWQFRCRCHIVGHGGGDETGRRFTVFERIARADTTRAFRRDLGDGGRRQLGRDGGFRRLPFVGIRARRRRGRDQPPRRYQRRDSDRTNTHRDL